MIRKWLHWPEGFYEDQGKHFLPWYSILRRLLVMPAFLLTVTVMWVVIWVGFGIDDANDVVKKIKP